MTDRQELMAEISHEEARLAALGIGSIELNRCAVECPAGAPG